MDIETMTLEPLRLSLTIQLFAIEATTARKESSILVQRETIVVTTGTQITKDRIIQASAQLAIGVPRNQLLECQLLILMAQTNC